MSYTSRSVQSAAPQFVDRRQLRVGGIDKRLYRQSFAGRSVDQQVYDAEAVGRVGVLEVIDGRDVRQKVEPVLPLEPLERAVELLRRHDDPAVVAEAVLPDIRSESFLEGGEFDHGGK
jgi:hypothetical protein